jgi:glycosyltransferase involved in cell wall biosynthesis
MLKICFITSSFPNFRCGVGDHVYQIYNQLKKENIATCIITSNIKNQITFDNKDISYIINKWDLTSWLKIFKSIPSDVEIVHFQYPTQYPVNRSTVYRFIPLTLIFSAINLIYGNKYKKAITIHEFYQSSFLHKLKVIIDCSLSEVIFVVTPIDEILLKNFFFLRKKIRFIPVGSNIIENGNPIELSVDELRAKHKINESHKIILFFGVLARNRGFETLIDSISLISNDFNNNLKIIVIGSSVNPLYVDELKQIIKNKSLNNFFEWYGYVEDERLIELIKLSDCTIQPFLNGANTNRSSIIAALKFNLPIITTSLSNITPQIFEDGINMYLVSPGNSQLIAERLRDIFKNQNTKDKLRKGMADLSKLFEWHNSTKIMIEEYKKLFK